MGVQDPRPSFWVGWSGTLSRSSAPRLTRALVVSRETSGAEMLDLDDGAGEDEGLERSSPVETVVRGLRRGRNKSVPPSPSEPEAETAPSDPSEETGAPPSADAADGVWPGSGQPSAPPPTPGSDSAERGQDDPPEPVEALVEEESPIEDVPSIEALAPIDSPADLRPPGPQSEGSPPPIEVLEASVGVFPDTGEIDIVAVAQYPVETTEPASVAISTEPGPPAETPTAGQVETVRSAVEPAVAEPAVAVEDEPQEASGNPLPRVLAVANQKGGVGKTTTAVNLGAALAELGFRVLVVDLDPQGNATTGLGVDARTFELSMYDVLMRDASLEDCIEPTSMKNLFVAPATIALAGAEIELVPAFSRELKLKRSVETVLEEFDYILIDCPPSLGLITVNALAAADEVLVPIQCEYYALEGLSQLLQNVHLVASNLNPKLDISTIVLTMYDARTKLADQVARDVRLHFGAKVCRNVIPRTVRLSEAPSFGQPITVFDPASRGAIAYRELAKEVSGGTT